MKQSLQFAFFIGVLILGSSDLFGKDFPVILPVNPHQSQAQCFNKILKIALKSTEQETSFFQALLSNGHYKVCDSLHIIELSKE